MSRAWVYSGTPSGARSAWGFLGRKRLLERRSGMGVEVVSSTTRTFSASGDSACPPACASEKGKVTARATLGDLLHVAPAPLRLEERKHVSHPAAFVLVVVVACGGHPALAGEGARTWATSWQGISSKQTTTGCFSSWGSSYSGLQRR